jgi:pyridoxal phosphate enzyme (YggS family)
MMDTSADLVQRLTENVRAVQDQIAATAAAAGRTPESVRLVAVTKYVDTPVAATLAQVLATMLTQNATATSDQTAECISAQVMLGENRVQVLQQRWEQWPADLPVQWHMIGPLQSNKIKQVAGSVDLFHAWDRFELLDKLQAYAATHELRLAGLLEFRLSDDATKHGFSASDLPQLLDRWSQWPNLTLRGVMGMSGLTATPAEAQGQFEQLRATFDRIGGALPAPARTAWCELSMGMSGDLPQAIAAGATLVRIGSALFRGVRLADGTIG